MQIRYIAVGNTFFGQLVINYSFFQQADVPQVEAAELNSVNIDLIENINDAVFQDPEVPQITHKASKKEVCYKTNINYQMDIKKLNLNENTISEWVDEHDKEKEKDRKPQEKIGHLLRDGVDLVETKRRYFNRFIVKKMIQLGEKDDATKEEKSWEPM